LLSRSLSVECVGLFHSASSTWYATSFSLAGVVCFVFHFGHVVVAGSVPTRRSSDLYWSASAEDVAGNLSTTDVMPITTDWTAPRQDEHTPEAPSRKRLAGPHIITKTEVIHLSGSLAGETGGLIHFGSTTGYANSFPI